jgi:hypothetical protein
VTRVLLLCSMLMSLAACQPTQTIVDQCMRVELFSRCLAAAPAGPQTTTYNDWAEVISQCRSEAYYQSLRMRAHIKPECRAE